MTAPPTGTPWWAWMIVAVVVVLGPLLSAVLVAAINRPIRRSLKVVRQQTENEHSATEYPNLRDELTATREAAEKAVDAVERVEAGQHRHDAEIGGLRDDVRQTRTDVGHLRTEHAETRAWVGAEASERRALATDMHRLADAQAEHLGFAAERDRQIASLHDIVRRHHRD